MTGGMVSPFRLNCALTSPHDNRADTFIAAIYLLRALLLNTGSGFLTSMACPLGRSCLLKLQSAIPVSLCAGFKSKLSTFLIIDSFSAPAVKSSTRWQPLVTTSASSQYENKQERHKMFHNDLVPKSDRKREIDNQIFSMPVLLLIAFVRLDRTIQYRLGFSLKQRGAPFTGPPGQAGGRRRRKRRKPQ